jgi:hypothetical protein
VWLKNASIRRPRERLGEYVVQASRESLDAFTEEVRSHGFIYDASWRELADDELTWGEAVSFEAIRADLYWLFED